MKQVNVQKELRTNKNSALNFVLMKQKKLRAIIFLCLVACTLFFLFVYLLLALFIPSLAHNEKLLLEGRKATQLVSLNTQTLMDASFQNSFEKYASDAFPIRDEVLLFNAFTQRSSIFLASTIFSYDVYHTYYGSDCIYSKKDGRVCRTPYITSDKFANKLQTCADGLNKLKDCIPGKLVYCLPANLTTSSLNPSYALISNSIDETYMQEYFLDKLDDRWLTYADTYSSLETYSTNYFSSDHHWNINGAVKNYQQIVKLLGKEPVTFSNSYKIDYLNEFYGAYARRGMDLQVTPDYIYDVDYLHSKLTVTANGKEQTEIRFLDDGYETDYSKKWQPKKSYSDSYANYFHYMYGELVLENPSSSNNETLLVIGDSFTECMDRFFAENYGRVVVVNPTKTTEKLSDIAQKYNAKDCVCVLVDSTLQSSATIKAFKQLAE